MDNSENTVVHDGGENGAKSAETRMDARFDGSAQLARSILTLQPDERQTPAFLIGYACARTQAAKLFADQAAGDAATSRSSEKVQEQSDAFTRLIAQNRKLDEDMLSTALWLYRRLHRCYGRPPFMEHPILRLSDKLGVKIDDDLAERGPAPASEDGK